MRENARFEFCWKVRRLLLKDVLRARFRLVF